MLLNALLEDRDSRTFGDCKEWTSRTKIMYRMQVLLDPRLDGLEERLGSQIGFDPKCSGDSGIAFGHGQVILRTPSRAQLLYFARSHS